MRLLAGVAVGVFLAGPALAAAPSGACGKLASDYDLLDRQVAMNFVDGVVDDSAPRATVRALRDLDAHTKQLMILEIMRSQNCALPTVVGGDALYLSSALSCQTAQMKGTTDAPECKMSDWVRADKAAKTR